MQEALREWQGRSKRSGQSGFGRTTYRSLEGMIGTPPWSVGQPIHIWRLHRIKNPEDIQDFLEVFEGIMRIYRRWIRPYGFYDSHLCSGKVRTVCTGLRSTTEYDGAILIREVSKTVQRTCVVKGSGTHWFSCKKCEDGKTWIQIMESIAYSQQDNYRAAIYILNGMPQEMRIWVASHDPETSEKI